MKSAIKIIKRKPNNDSNNMASANEASSSSEASPVERGTREMVSTVKGWIAELQQRKRAEAHSFAGLPGVVTVHKSEYLETPA